MYLLLENPYHSLLHTNIIWQLTAFISELMLYSYLSSTFVHSGSLSRTVFWYLWVIICVWVSHINFIPIPILALSVPSSCIRSVSVIDVFFFKILGESAAIWHQGAVGLAHVDRTNYGQCHWDRGEAKEDLEWCWWGTFVGVNWKRMNTWTLGCSRNDTLLKKIVIVETTPPAYVWTSSKRIQNVHLVKKGKNLPKFCVSRFQGKEEKAAVRQLFQRVSNIKCPDASQCNNL